VLPCSAAVLQFRADGLLYAALRGCLLMLSASPGCTAPPHCTAPAPPSCTACCCRDYLEEAELERLPEGAPSYLTAAVGPPTTAAPRKFCSVCGDVSTYTCTRCGSRYCGRRCHAVHTETRCLKFLA
jgi:hypothetical protein